MKVLKAMAPLLLALAMLSILAACGSDKRQSSTPNQVVFSQRCIGCHSGTNSHVTGNSVVQEWLASAHSRAPFGAGCDDCHHVDGHPENGVTPPLPADTVCLGCHGALVPISGAHFSNFTGTGTRFGASFTGLPRNRFAETLINPATGDRSSSACNGCHNPHDVSTLLPVNRQWAASAHGNVQDEPFNEDPFIKSTSCSRCHSATGFRYYMTHSQTPITTAVLGSYSSAQEAISCNGCHTNYSWRRIATDPSSPATVAAFVNFSTPYPRFPGISKNFPSTSTVASNAPIAQMGDSRTCVPCHSGRTGRTGASVAANTAGPFDSHYFAAAAVMYGKIGFINFTSLTAPIGATTYGNTLRTSEDVAGGVSSTHRRLGTPAIIGDHGITASQTLLTQNGPCVVCHMTAGHTLAINAVTYNNVCINCHSSERGVPLNANNFLEVFVEENRQQMDDALALAVKLLTINYGIGIDLRDVELLETPQDITFIEVATGAPIGDRGIQATNWAAYLTRHPLTTTQLYKLKGAMFNISLFYKENAAFVHARTLTRRMIYDTIDFLDDGTMDLSVGATALGPIGQSILSANGTPAFGKGATAFTDATLTALAPGTTPSMTYILGFSRTTGAWTTPERP
jgi:hypothetical protein